MSHPVEFLLSNIYRPQMKLQERNVFTGVCLSTGAGVHMSGPMSFLGGGYLWYQICNNFRTVLELLTLHLNL